MAQKLSGSTSRAAFAAEGFALVLALTMGGLGARSAAAQLAAAEPSPKKAEEVYENIQVLKGVPYGQVIPTMQLISESLGVECEFCHDESSRRELDVKPTKQIARKMFQMVFAINKESFGGRPAVTCYSCHRGSVKPVELPGLAVREPKPEVAEPKGSGRTNADSMPTVNQVLDKYLAALGGLAVIQKNTSRIERGTVTTTRPGQPSTRLPVEIFARVPDRRFTKAFSVTHLGNSPEAFGVYNGNAAWLREGSGPVRLMFGWRRDAAKLEDTLNFPTQLKQIVSQLRVERTEKINDGDAHVVSGRTEFLPLVELYFDTDSGLLTRLVYYVETVVGPVPSQIDYGDYRDVDGLKIPFRRTVALVRGVRATYQIEEVRQNVPLEDSQFALPTPPPSLYR